MGGAFQLINLDKRQTLGQWGPMSEWLSTTAPSDVVPYLTIPFEPLKASTRNIDLIGSWAGDRIICIGEDVNPGDYPQAAMIGGESTVEKLFHVAKAYDAVPFWGLPHPQAEAYAQDEVWVLRNLSKRQYVRSNALEDIPVQAAQQGTSRRLGLGDVLLSKISWTSTGSMASYVGDIDRGVWAGDKIDIRTLDTVEYDEYWRDVSREVVEEMTTNWAHYSNFK